MEGVSRADAGAALDGDLVEYLLVSVATLDRVDGVVAAVAELVRSGTIRLIDVVLLRRAGGQASVVVGEADDVEELSPLSALADRRARLSSHDIALAAVTVGPDDAALLLLVEDRWAASLSAAAQRAGGRFAGGERVSRERFLTATRPGADAKRLAVDDLLVRGPATSDHPELAVDPAAQLQTLAELVDRGVLTLEQYEAQRRRVLAG